MTRTRRPARHSYVKDVTGSAIAGPGDPSRISKVRRDPNRPPVQQGIVIKDLQGAVATDDGRNILVTLRRAEGESSTLVCPTAIGPSLVSLILQSLATAQRKLGNSNSRQVLVAESLRLLPAGSGRFVAVIRISGGAEMSFLLPAETAKELMATLDPERRRAAQAAGSATP